MMSLKSFAVICCAMVPWTGRAAAPFEVDARGRVIFAHREIPEEWRNVWPAEWEEEFVERTNASLRASRVEPGRYGGTFFENEKSSYPMAFIGLLKGQTKEALAFLQADDDAAWSRQLTMGVDWYPSFTIRSQTRKYFQFGPLLEPDYLRKMKESAAVWTSSDPLGRAHPFWVRPEDRKAKGMGGEGWTPEYHNSWVDVRGTDNLRAMREQAIYLMAVETGNRAAAEASLSRIRAYATALYETGMPEWDSPNYLNHALTAWLPLYDFAEDQAVRALAKALLDHICTAAAVKYYRGSWAGPGIRDYGNIGPHAGAAGEFWHYFGGLAEAAREPYRDFVHVMASAYRPPAAVVALARRDFPRPAEIFAAKPSYTGWQQAGGEAEPAYYETTWIGHHSQMGSLPRGHADAPGMNLNGFRILAENGRRGADTIICFTADSWNHSHATATSGNDHLAQCRHTLVWTSTAPRPDFHFFVPRSAKITQSGHHTFLQLEKTWIALCRSGIGEGQRNAQLTGKACGARKEGEAPRFPEDEVWTFPAEGNGPSAFAIAIGEPESHGSFEEFCRKCRDSARLERTDVHTFGFHDGGQTAVGITPHPPGLPLVLRDGKEHQWTAHRDLWGGPESPVQLGWKTGTLTVTAGGHRFATKLP
ncbi:MAG: hypothetical protein ACK5CW_08055 [Verrucomicrobiota bacterium]